MKEKEKDSPREAELRGVTGGQNIPLKRTGHKTLQSLQDEEMDVISGGQNIPLKRTGTNTLQSLQDKDMEVMSGGANRLEPSDPPEGTYTIRPRRPSTDEPAPPPDDRGTMIEGESNLGGDTGSMDLND